MQSEDNEVLNLLEQDNYEVAYNEAVRQLSELNIEEVTKKSGAAIISTDSGSKVLHLNFLADQISITFPDISVSYKDREDEIPLWHKILILHYLIYSKGTVKSGEEIAFKQLEGGMLYNSAFMQQTMVPLVNEFGENLKAFIRAGEIMGGVKAEYGDYALTFTVFPRIEITFLFWAGDEEFPTEGNIIFDKTVADYLTTEDVAVLCNMIAIILIKKKI